MERMSRRTIGIVVVFLTVLVVANILVIAVWLPRHKNANAPNGVVQNGSAPASVAPNNTVPTSNSSTTAVAPTKPGRVQPPTGATAERQVVSPSGNLVIKYLRDRKTKIRQIAVQDAKRPNDSAVVFETKYLAWALVSPDDQWIVVAERKGNGEGNIKLLHRNGPAGIQFTPVQEGGGEGLQETVWNAYINAMQADPNTARRGAAIDATAWASDSRKLNLSIVYMPGPKNQEVPAPWSCTYDVTSKQVEPVTAPADDAADETAQQPEDEQAESPTEVAANNPADDGSAAETDDTAAEDELPGERFAATRLDELTVPDVNESSVEEITYAMNEMYARHGAEFKDQTIATQFSEFPWYKPRPGLSLSGAEEEFTDLEKANMKVLRTCRDSKIAATKRKSSSGRKQQVREEGAGEKALRAFRLWQDAGAPVPPHH